VDVEERVGGGLGKDGIGHGDEIGCGAWCWSGVWRLVSRGTVGRATEEVRDGAVAVVEEEPVSAIVEL
jgi:hypothetical protein